MDPVRKLLCHKIEDIEGIAVYLQNLISHSIYKSYLSNADLAHLLSFSLRAGAFTDLAYQELIFDKKKNNNQENTLYPQQPSSTHINS